MQLFVQRAARARTLAVLHPASNEILTFYGRVLEWQGEQLPGVYGFSDLSGLLISLVDMVSAFGPAPLVEAGSAIEPADVELLLRKQWESPGPFGPESFFARVLLQLYAATVPEGLDCAWCDRDPQVGCLTTLGDGRAYHLVCALCFRRRSSMRAKCPRCGETEEKKLPTFSTDALPALSLKACDSCHGYMVVVDLENEVEAIPEVDEMVALPLELKARAMGYEKLLPNLAGC